VFAMLLIMLGMVINTIAFLYSHTCRSWHLQEVSYLPRS
jgi:hypothetical protein